MQRLVDTNGIIPLIEPIDAQAGIDADSFDISDMTAVCIVLVFGVVTTDGATLTVQSGATVGAKTTAEAFRYKWTTGDFKAANSDVFDATETADADGVITLTAASTDHRTLAIYLEAVEITAGQPWITLTFGAQADALFVAGVAIPLKPHYAVPGTFTA